MSEKLKALENGDGYDFRYEKEPRCPHCGQSSSITENEWWKLYEEGEHEIECPLCDIEFTVSVFVDYRYSTDEQGQ